VFPFRRQCAGPLEGKPSSFSMKVVRRDATSGRVRRRIRVARPLPSRTDLQRGRAHLRAGARDHRNVRVSMSRRSPPPAPSGRSRIGVRVAPDVPLATRPARGGKASLTSIRVRKSSGFALGAELPRHACRRPGRSVRQPPRVASPVTDVDALLPNRHRARTRAGHSPLSAPQPWVRRSILVGHPPLSGEPRDL
jgi:hypothetical protein